MKDVKCIVTNDRGRTFLWSVYPSLTAEDGFKEFLKYHPNHKDDARLIPITDLVNEPDSNLVRQVEQLLSHAYIGEIWSSNDRIIVDVSGDWKHDHLHTDYLVTTAFDLVKECENVTESNDSDSYKAEHYYRLENSR